MKASVEIFTAIERFVASVRPYIIISMLRPLTSDLPPVRVDELFLNFAALTKGNS